MWCVICEAKRQGYLSGIRNRNPSRVGETILPLQQLEVGLILHDGVRGSDANGGGYGP